MRRIVSHFRRRPIPGLTGTIWLTALGLMAWGLLVDVSSAWGRAGGGGSYGGGGGGGGGGGSGGGGGDLIRLLILLCVRHPVIGIPLTIAIVAFLVYGGRSAREGHITRTIRRGYARQDQLQRTRSLSAIAQRDPAFDVDRFLDRARSAFVAIQDAWSGQDLSQVRAFISDGIHERFTLQIGMQQAEGIRNQMSDVTIFSAGVVAAFTDDGFDTLHVRFHASAVDVSVDLQTGRRRSGSGQPQEFVEFWSFHRRPGAKSLSGPGTVEGHCPRCAAPLQIVDVARCTSCGAQVNSGEFDWVLAEITQDQEWRVPGSERGIPGLADLKARDPQFSIQHVEDRVSVMFWRLRSAEFHRDASYARPVVSPRFLPEFARNCETLRDHDEFWKDPAVGKVEIIDADSGTDGTPDRVRVKVRWSGIYCSGDPRGGARELRDQAICTHVFVLARRHGVRSVARATFTSAGCPSCGAPIAVNTEGACTFCGTNITDGRHDWVLDDVCPFTPDLAFSAREALPAEPAVEQRLELNGDAELSLAILARVMATDGQMAPAEVDALHRLGAHRGISRNQVDLAIRSARTGETELPVPQDSQQALRHLEQLVHAVLADGQITAGEKRFLAQYARRFDLTAADVRMTVSRERRRAYQSARKQLRRSRHDAEA